MRTEYRYDYGERRLRPSYVYTPTFQQDYSRYPVTLEGNMIGLYMVFSVINLGILPMFLYADQTSIEPALSGRSSIIVGWILGAAQVTATVVLKRTLCPSQPPGPGIPPPDRSDSGTRPGHYSVLPI
jgi:hypothetical protein